MERPSRPSTEAIWTARRGSLPGPITARAPAVRGLHAAPAFGRIVERLGRSGLVLGGCIRGSELHQRGHYTKRTVVLKVPSGAAWQSQLCPLLPVMLGFPPYALLEYEARRILDRAGIPMSRHGFAKSAEEASRSPRT